MFKIHRQKHKPLTSERKRQEIEHVDENHRIAHTATTENADEEESNNANQDENSEQTHNQKHNQTHPHYHRRSQLTIQHNINSFMVLPNDVILLDLSHAVHPNIDDLLEQLHNDTRSIQQLLHELHHFDNLPDHNEHGHHGQISPSPHIAPYEADIVDANEIDYIRWVHRIQHEEDMTDEATLEALPPQCIVHANHSLLPPLMHDNNAMLRYQSARQKQAKRTQSVRQWQHNEEMWQSLGEEYDSDTLDDLYPEHNQDEKPQSVCNEILYAVDEPATFEWISASTTFSKHADMIHAPSPIKLAFSDEWKDSGITSPLQMHRNQGSGITESGSDFDRYIRENDFMLNEEYSSSELNHKNDRDIIVEEEDDDGQEEEEEEGEDDDDEFEEDLKNFHVDLSQFPTEEECFPAHDD